MKIKSFAVKSVSSVMIALVTAMGLYGCSGAEDKDRVKSSDNLLASVQKSDSIEEFDFKDTITKPENYDNYSSKNIDLALGLLKNQDYSKDNIAVAPVSVTLTLSALENSMNGATLSQVKPFIGKTTYTTDITNKCSSYITQRLKFFNDDKSGVFNVGSTWVSDGSLLKRSFQQKYKNFFDISMYQADFSAENINTIMSNYIKDNSNGYIHTGSIKTSSDYKLYLDCSLAVSDVWLKGYEDTSTKKGSFKASNGKFQEVTYLVSAERTFIVKNAVGFVKDFKNIPCKLVCILPDEKIGMSKYISELDNEKYIDIMTGISPTGFSAVSMPEFTVEQTGSIKEVLSNIGMDKIFTKDADLSKGFSEKLFVDDITQSVGIKIDKNGCYTEEEAEVSDVDQKSEGKIELNRPFIYAVIDNESYMPLIIGTVNSIDN